MQGACKSHAGDHGPSFLRNAERTSSWNLASSHANVGTSCPKGSATRNLERAPR